MKIYYFGLGNTKLTINGVQSDITKNGFIVITDSDVGLISTKGFIIRNVDLSKIHNEKILRVQYEIRKDQEASLLNSGVLHIEVDEGNGFTSKISCNNVLKDNIHILNDLIKEKASLN